VLLTYLMALLIPEVERPTSGARSRTGSAASGAVGRRGGSPTLGALRQAFQVASSREASRPVTVLAGLLMELACLSWRTPAHIPGGRYGGSRIT
jgi:hypothetical protein